MDNSSDTERLVRVDTKLDLLIQRVEGVVKDHETRLRVVETRSVETQTKLRTWLTLVGSGATGAGTLLGTLLSHLTGA